MKADSLTNLAQGVFRNRCVYSLLINNGLRILIPRSVRITGKKVYNTGLFILDLNAAPWGCGQIPFLCPLPFKIIIF